MAKENQQQQFDPVQFGIGVMKDHEDKLVRLLQQTLQTPINHYTDREGNLDRQLVSQQMALRSTLLLSLSNQLGRLQMALYSLACQRVGVDYGEIMNEMVDATSEFEDGMDRIHAIATNHLPLSPEADDLADPAEPVEPEGHRDDPGPPGEPGPAGQPDEEQAAAGSGFVDMGL